MQFNSYLFILYFLPLSLLVYYAVCLVKPELSKFVLILASIIFYSYGRTEMLIYLAISMLINYCSAFLIKKKQLHIKIALFLPIAVNIGLLLYFKYLNFAIDNINAFTNLDIQLLDIVLPLGISFYTFQQIAYLVATYNNELNNNNLIDYVTYILFFPKLLMGPITDPIDFISQINDHSRKKPNIYNIASGLKIFSLGLIKKVLLADTFSKGVSWVYNNIESATAMECILLVLFYSFEIYFDFSGYSDMAIGISSMFNIDLPMNFDSPYKAISIRDFWKRWHISLTKFLTKYIYIPLGGSRKGVLFTYINTLIVFLISGLWHGANWTFILWGLLHGLLSCFDRAFDKFEDRIFMPVRWLCTFIAVNILWLLFSAPSISIWQQILTKIIFMQKTSISDELISAFNLSEQTFIYNLLRMNYLQENVRGLNMTLFILAAFIICFIPENNYKNKNILTIASLFLSSIAFIWGILCLGSESTFVYFGF